MSLGPSPTDRQFPYVRRPSSSSVGGPRGSASVVPLLCRRMAELTVQPIAAPATLKMRSFTSDFRPKLTNKYCVISTVNDKANATPSTRPMRQPALASMRPSGTNKAALRTPSLADPGPPRMSGTVLSPARPDVGRMVKNTSAASHITNRIDSVRDDNGVPRQAHTRPNAVSPSSRLANSKKRAITTASA